MLQELKAPCRELLKNRWFTLEFLHAQGAPIDSKHTSADGSTPRDVALAEGNSETAALIERLLAE